MRIELGDVLVLLGAVLLLYGLFAFDWRLAAVGGGALLMVAGLARLRRMAQRRVER